MTAPTRSSNPRNGMHPTNSSTLSRSTVAAPALVGAALAAGLAACGSGGTSPPQPSPAPAASAAGGGAGTDTARAAVPPRRAAGARGERRRREPSVDPSAQEVDRVAAVVGDTTLLLSEVREEIFRRRSRGLEVPSSPAARDSLMRSVLREMIEELILLQEAQRTGVSVPEDRLDQMVEQQFQRIRSNFSSPERFRRAVEQTGQNMYQYRQMLRSQARKQLMIQSFIQQNQNKLPPIAIPEDQIRRVYEQRFQDQSRPATLSLDRLLVHPAPAEAAEDSARAVAERALEQIRSGTDFAVAVRRFSDDSATRERGGELGWMRRQDVAPSFGDAAWSAPPGRPVGPVRSRLGFHIIKVENVRAGERNLRHLLVRPRITEEDLQEARELARDLADSLRAGADPDSLAGEYGERGRVEGKRTNEVEVRELESQLGSEYASAISSPEAGKVVGPFRTSSGGPHPALAAARISEYRPEGTYALEDVRDRIRDQLRQQRQFERFLERLRDEYYVKILI